MSDPQQRRERAEQDAKQRQKREQRDAEISQKREQADREAPDPSEVQGPPWNTAVLLYLQTLDKRLERIEAELGIEE